MGNRNHPSCGGWSPWPREGISSQASLLRLSCLPMACFTPVPSPCSPTSASGRIPMEVPSLCTLESGPPFCLSFFLYQYGVFPLLVERRNEGRRHMLRRKHLWQAECWPSFQPQLPHPDRGVGKIVSAHLHLSSVWGKDKVQTLL